MEFIDYSSYLQASTEAVRSQHTCFWRGHNSEGTELRCSNRRLLHPSRYVRDSLGAIVRDVLLTCPYHSQECVGEHNERRKVLTPNTWSLCSECYFLKEGHRPVRIFPAAVPGVFPKDSDVVVQQKRPTILTLVAPRNGKSLCEWTPFKDNAERQQYRCMNNVLRDEFTREFLPLCAYHTTACPRLHLHRGEGVIKIPNAKGLCVQHHLQETGSAPTDLVWPFPGTTRVPFRTFDRCATSHWAAPNWLPPPDLIVKWMQVRTQSSGGNRHSIGSSIPPRQCQNTQNHALAVAGLPTSTNAQSIFPQLVSKGMQRAILKTPTLFETLYSKDRHRNAACIRIQARWRGYRQKNIHLELFFETYRRLRLAAALRIQTLMRGYLVRRHWRDLIRDNNHYAIQIQCCIRAYLARKIARILRATVRLQRFLRWCRQKLMWESIQTLVAL